MTISIGILHKETILVEIGDLLNKNLDKIDEAYTKNENELSLSITVQLQPNRTDGTDITTNLSFVESKIKDSRFQTVPDRQKQLFKSIEGMRPEKGSGIDSVSLTTPHNGKTVTLEAK